MSAHQHVYLREPATVIPGPVPKQYEFLKAPGPLRKYRINFRHPAYARDDNPLFTLYAWDHVEGGIHHGLAHNACSIFADNRIDGYLSRTCDGEHGERIKAAWDDFLPAADTDYYFYRQASTNMVFRADSALPPSGESRPPYRWPVVANFQGWKFPSVMPEIWTRCERTQGTGSNTAPQSTLTAAIRQRDVSCRITAFESGTEVAHLVPEHERQWFLSNSMATWNTDLTLDPDNLLRDFSNAVLLRSDMHTAFDQRKFVFFPKDSEGFVLHMLEPTSDIGLLYHNTRLNIPQCSLEFLLRGERVVEEVTNAIVLGRKGTASRSNSPTKRSRIAAGLDEEDDEYTPKRHRICEAASAQCSFDSSLSTLEDTIGAGHGQLPSHLHTMDTAQSSWQSENGEIMELPPENVYIEGLQRKALAQQRPPGYVLQRSPYDRHRPAKDELELMGVEIIESLDDDLYDTDLWTDPPT
ncbi:uncharacterized protein PAC_13937 [Phialocephala subalpina]|uniref:HNH nuclease domain-containing protein n=1 Tax=Phialocephala subalpina TaxID=576137 RepID=A0A1L7XG73_9HELO|nr:uncharacterized protein PAC_13937 [Phialocephala subalpina]